VRDSLRAGLETSAEQQLDSLVAQVEASGVPASAEESDDGDEDLEDPEDMVWQILDESGAVVSSSQPRLRPLPHRDDVTRLPAADHGYLVVVDAADAGGRDHGVVVAVALEEVDDSSSALLGPLLVGLPTLLLFVGITPWFVASRA